jgi:hypothetical protein
LPSVLVRTHVQAPVAPEATSCAIALLMAQRHKALVKKIVIFFIARFKLKWLHMYKLISLLTFRSWTIFAFFFVTLLFHLHCRGIARSKKTFSTEEKVLYFA